LIIGDDDDDVDDDDDDVVVVVDDDFVDDFKLGYNSYRISLLKFHNV